MARRLAAILIADVVGYSRLMETDETGTLKAMRERRVNVLEPLLRDHAGRIVKMMGDGVLVEFASAANAVSCAMTLQSRMLAANEELPPERQIVLRIGINLGDVVGEGSDIFGEGVNIAARLEALAEPGGICLSSSVHESIGSRLGQAFVDAGLQELKNITRPIRVWRWPGEVVDYCQAQQALAVPDKPSIVVLPFDNMSGDPEQDYFADGVVESITAALSRIRAFFVIARNSAFAYKRRPKNVRDIGRELGVAYVLEGSVQRGGSRVRITVQLVETVGGAHLWADRYDGTLDDIFDLQDRIAEHVAGALQPSIRLAEVERARRKRPQDLNAYDYTMRAMRHVWVLEKEEASTALKLLGQALTIDPDYPLALALAAWCWAQRSVYNWVADTASARAKALRLADRAVSHSTEDPLILAVLGTVQTFARHYGAARVMLEHALSLDPNSAWVHSRLGWLEVYASRPEQARALFEKAIRLSPLDPINFNNYFGLGCAKQVTGDDDGAANLFIRALQERPNAKWIHRNLCTALHAAGRFDEASQSRDALLQAYPDMSVRKLKDAMVFAPDVLERIATHLRALGLPEA